MPQLSDCIRWADRYNTVYASNGSGRLVLDTRVLQVKHNGTWVDVPAVDTYMEVDDDHSG